MLIRCSVCGEYFEPYSTTHQMDPGRGRTEDDNDTDRICYNCLSVIDMTLYEDEEGEVEEVEDDEDEF